MTKSYPSNYEELFWRDIHTTPPPPEKYVLVRLSFATCEAAFTAGRWRTGHPAATPLEHAVLAWMPLPAPPYDPLLARLISYADLHALSKDLASKGKWFYLRENQSQVIMFSRAISEDADVQVYMPNGHNFTCDISDLQDLLVIK